VNVGGVFLPLAFLAGVVSFISPCVLPLVPGYLSAVTGASYRGQSAPPPLRSVVPASLLFLAGFLAVFVALGATASVIGSALAKERSTFNLVAGGFVVAMGAAMLADATLPALGLGRAGATVHRLAAAKGGPVALGVAFAFCWTPCIGPVLASILVLAGASLTLSQGVLLLFVYGLGLALPFILCSLAFARALAAFRRLRELYRALQFVGGAVLIAMGVLLMTNRLYVVNIYAQHLLAWLHLDWWTKL
jgi:cytochrome c-type biogenesis protein